MIINQSEFDKILNNRISRLVSPAIDYYVSEQLRNDGDISRLFFYDRSAAELKARTLEELKKDSYKEVFDRYPLLGNIRDVIVKDHREMQQEFEKRVRRDCDAISRSFFDGAAIESIDGLEAAGDTHDCGRPTLIVRTDAGSFLYKNRSSCNDTVLGKILDRYCSDIARVPDSIDCKDYSYYEFIRNHPADNTEDIRKYYYNLGGVGAIVQALGIYDLHFENLMVETSRLVFVDTEALLGPGFGKKVSNTGTFFGEVHAAPVYRSGIMPCAVMNKQLSVLVSTEDANLCMPAIDGVKQPGTGYKEEILRGYEDTYDILMDGRADIGRMLDELRGTRQRIILRPTSDYEKIVYYLNRPEYAADENSQKRALDIIIFRDTEGRNLSGVTAIEKDAIMHRDYPMFYVCADGVDVFNYSGITERNLLEKSPLQNAKDCLGRLSPEDKRFTAELFDKSLEYVFTQQYDVKKEKDAPETEPLDRRTAAAHAVELIDRIYDETIVSAGGRRGLVYYCEQAGHIEPMLPHLGDGMTGIGVFAAAVLSGAAPANARASELVDMTVDQINDYLNTQDSRHQPGFVDGLGGIIAGLSVMYEYLGREDIRKQLERSIEAVERLEFGSVTNADFYGGLSGLLFALCRYTDRRDLIEKCADRITELKSFEYKGRTLWQTINKHRHISGFGHGQAGIAAALTEAYVITGSTLYRECAEEAFDYELDAYAPAKGTWPDFRENPLKEWFMHGICSGAPGIVLAFAVGHRAGIVSDASLQLAVDALDADVEVPCDHLCCGRSAKVFVLLTLGEYSRAGRILNGMYRRQLANGDYTYIVPTFNNVINTSLLSGTAGIGYVMLMYAENNKEHIR